MGNIVAYMLHDPIGRMERQISSYDVGEIRKATEQGAVVIGVDGDGNRSIVRPEDVREPQTATREGVTLVMPKYVNDRLSIVCDALEAVARSLPEEDAGTVMDCVGRLRGEQ